MHSRAGKAQRSLPIPWLQRCECLIAAFWSQKEASIHALSITNVTDPTQPCLRFLLLPFWNRWQELGFCYRAPASGHVLLWSIVDRRTVSLKRVDASCRRDIRMAWESRYRLGYTWLWVFTSAGRQEVPETRPVSRYTWF